MDPGKLEKITNLGHLKRQHEKENIGPCSEADCISTNACDECGPEIQSGVPWGGAGTAAGPNEWGQFQANS